MKSSLADHREAIAQAVVLIDTGKADEDMNQKMGTPNHCFNLTCGSRPQVKHTLGQEDQGP